MVVMKNLSVVIVEVDVVAAAVAIAAVVIERRNTVLLKMASRLVVRDVGQIVEPGIVIRPLVLILMLLLLLAPFSIYINLTRKLLSLGRWPADAYFVFVVVRRCPILLLFILVVVVTQPSLEETLLLNGHHVVSLLAEDKVADVLRVQAAVAVVAVAGRLDGGGGLLTLRLLVGVVVVLHVYLEDVQAAAG